MHPKFFHTQRGFTLLEVITTLVMVGILATISLPTYTHYILKTRRAHAAVALVDLAASLERYRSLHQTYLGATLENLEINAYTENTYYQMQISNLTDDSYLLQATPLKSQVEDKACGTLSIDQTGLKQISGAGSTEQCF